MSFCWFCHAAAYLYVFIRTCPCMANDDEIGYPDSDTLVLQVPIFFISFFKTKPDPQFTFYGLFRGKFSFALLCIWMHKMIRQAALFTNCRRWSDIN